MTSRENEEGSSAAGFPFRRLVIKLGTNLLCGGTDHLDLGVMANLVDQVAQLHRNGLEIVIVSSGAIASGRYKLGLTRKLRGIPYRQVLASVGQSKLMQTYEQLFSRHDVTVAQALLTKRDLSDRFGYLNARNTLLALLELRVIPIVNENDVVATDEIQDMRFGDNDNLSAMVANLMSADLLMILTDTEGLYTADPRLRPDAKLISIVHAIDDDIMRVAGNASSPRGTGGMATKLEAAKLAISSGTAVVIANGREPDGMVRIARGERLGTYFPTRVNGMESRKRWILSRPARRGKLVIDGGAVTAIREQEGSLLPAGIKGAEGRFVRGDTVDICEFEGGRIGCGIVNYGSEEIEQLKGVHSDEIATILGHDYGAEVIHKDNLVIY